MSLRRMPVWPFAPALSRGPMGPPPTLPRRRSSRARGPYRLFIKPTETMMSASTSTPTAPMITGSRLARLSINFISHDVGQFAFLAEILGLVPEGRAQPGELVPADDAAGGVLALDLVDEEVLQGDDVAFHADDLGHVGDLARAVAQARCLHDHVDRAGDLLAHGLGGQVVAAHS